MARWILALFFLTIAILTPASGQNIERMCRQLNSNCAACQVYQAECSNIKPTVTQRPDYGGGGGYPESPGDNPNCFTNGKLCDTSTDCCSKNCVVVKVPLGGPDHFYTQRVCRANKYTNSR